MNIVYTTQFKRDYKLIKRQGKSLDKLRVTIEVLVSGGSLEPRYRDHQLAGKWSGHRDCHIEPDWILIYSISDDNLILERTGSHSELFKNRG